MPLINLSNINNYCWKILGNAENRTPRCSVKSSNATSVLCPPPLHRLSLLSLNWKALKNLSIVLFFEQVPLGQQKCQTFWNCIVTGWLSSGVTFLSFKGQFISWQLVTNNWPPWQLVPYSDIQTTRPLEKLFPIQLVPWVSYRPNLTMLWRAMLSMP